MLKSTEKIDIDPDGYKKPMPIYIEDDKSEHGVSQVTRLQKRGITIHDPHSVAKFLRTNMYYRVSAYITMYEPRTVMSIIQESTIGKRQKKVRILPRQHTYPEDLNFNEIKNMYLFDKRMRLMVIEAIEEIENSLKAIIVNKLVNDNPDMLWLDYSMVTNHAVLNKIQRSLFDKGNNSLFDHKNNYRIKIWKLTELLSFGKMVKIYDILKQQPYLEVCELFNLPEPEINPKIKDKRDARTKAKKKMVTSLLHTLATLRNHCVYHHRLIGCTTLPKQKPLHGYEIAENENHHLTNHIYTLEHIMQALRHDNTWFKRVCMLIDEYGQGLKYYKQEISIDKSSEVIRTKTEVDKKVQAGELSRSETAFKSKSITNYITKTEYKWSRNKEIGKTGADFLIFLMGSPDVLSDRYHEFVKTKNTYQVVTIDDKDDDVNIAPTYIDETELIK